MSDSDKPLTPQQREFNKRNRKLNADDTQVAKRLAQYQQEKGINAAPPEEFLEEVGLRKQLEEEEKKASALRDEQRVLLDTVKRLRDTEGFVQHHPELQRTDTAMPKSAPNEDVKPPVVDEGRSPLSNLMPTDLTGLAVHANLTYDEMEVLTGQKRERERLDAGLPNLMAEPTKAAQLARRFSTELRLAAGIILLAIPTLGWAIYQEVNTNARADAQQQQASAQYAEETFEVQSVAQQTNEPFRLPAGSIGPSGAPSASSGGEDGETDTGGWHKPVNPTPEPTPEQIAEDQKLIAMAQQMQADGNLKQATFLLSAALGKAPGDVQLVVATARAYIAAKDYFSARRILQSAMAGARTPADYNLFAQVLAEIPA